ncbi:glutathione S-transferase [Vibrio sp. 404]|uniref:Glutathione S-transferase n=1 Tax=Vibrio marinisediminis TaxID=2758441 RepID=A0A7W2ISV0_9VIBR|nr:glutathione S-transferase family protein [Vibrio marinisediminis]MBA5761362.1 glutathione S-transferase [Vibrio marinisediminis]
MNLYLNETSPFSRVALITAVITGNSDFQLVWVDPWSSPAELKQVNAFCMIPALELENGTNVVESFAICHFLVAKFKPETIQLPQLENEVEASLMGLSKTLMEVGFKSVALGRFIEQPNELSSRAVQGLELALLKLNQQLDGQYRHLAMQPTLATLYLHCALDYIAFRHSAIFERCAQQPINAFMHNSPFAKHLKTVSLDALATQPVFKDLVNNDIALKINGD